MSLQVFLYAQFRGIEGFVSQAPDNASFADRAFWVSMLGEIAPRAFLAEKGLSPLLAGYSGGGAFLLLIPEALVTEAADWMTALGTAASGSTAGQIALDVTYTENLGSWPNVWKRLRDGLRAKRLAPLSASGAAAFAPGLKAEIEEITAPWHGISERLQGAANVGWDPASPLYLLANEGPRQWITGAPPDGIPIIAPASKPEELGRSAKGQRAWGLLRCDIDHSGARLELADSAENFLYLAVLYKGLVAGELQRIAALPEFEGRTSIVYSGGDDFAIAGAWDALMGVAIEFQRVFTLFAQDLPGGREIVEGASVSAALTVAEPGESMSALWRRNRQSLEMVKSSGRNAFALFGRILEWPALKDAEGLKNRIRKLRESFHCPPEVFAELQDFYGVYGASDLLASVKARRRERSLERPWRFQNRLRKLAGDRSGTEFERQWRTFLGEMLGRGAGQKQLRPAGKVALDWAQLESGRRS